MDLSFLKYDLKEEMRNNYYNWQEILYGFDNQIINSSDIIVYATYILQEDIDNFDTIMEIVLADIDDNIKLLLEKLCKNEQTANEEQIKGKWLYLILKWLYNKKGKYSDEYLLEIIEEVYERFNYPRIIEPFVRYLPTLEDLGSLELNRKKLFNNLKQYLKNYEDTHQY